MKREIKIFRINENVIYKIEENLKIALKLRVKKSPKS